MCYYSIAALIIAHKFLRNDSSRLKHILAALKKPSQSYKNYEIKEIVKTEA